MLTLPKSPGAAEWWQTAKVTFMPAFAESVDAWLAANESEDQHPSMGIALGK